MNDWSGPSRQAGALVLLMPLVIAVCGIVTLMIVDVARLFAAQAELQGQATAAASAGVIGTQACGGDAVDLETMERAALSAASARKFKAESGTLDIYPGELVAGADHILNFRQAPISQSDSVLAVIRTNEPVSRAVPALFGSVELQASSAVRKQVVATISSAGSTLGIDGGLIGYLIGALTGQSNYALDPTDLASLENTLVQVGELVDAAGAESLNDLLSMQGAVLARAVRAVAGISSPTGELADDLLSVSGVNAVPVSSLIQLAEDSTPPDSTAIRAYDLLISLALGAAKEQQALASSGIVVDAFHLLDLPFIDEVDESEVEVRLIVNQPPTLAIGPARQDDEGQWVTEFLAADIGLEIQALYRQTGSTAEGILLPGVRYAVLETPMKLAIALGGGAGQLVSAECARGGLNEVSVAVDLQRSPAVLGTGEIGASGSFQSSRQVKSLKLTVGNHGLEQDLADVRIEYSVYGRITVADERRKFDGYDLSCRGEECHVSSYVTAGSAEEAVDTTLSAVVHNVDVDILNLSLVGPDSAAIELAVQRLFEESLNPTVQAVGYNLLNVLVKPIAQATGVSFGGVQVSLAGATQIGTQVVKGLAPPQL